MWLVIKDENGFLETYLLSVYLVFALTMFAFLAGLGFGMWREAQAKYSWFAEAVTFAAQAANTTGNLHEVELNTGLARKYFVAAMDTMANSYRLEEFQPVQPGDPVPGGRAQAPGYLARITQPVFRGKIPLIGQQYVEIPMSYFAVVKSGRI